MSETLHKRVDERSATYRIEGLREWLHLRQKTGERGDKWSRRACFVVSATRKCRIWEFMVEKSPAQRLVVVNVGATHPGLGRVSCVHIYKHPLVATLSSPLSNRLLPNASAILLQPFFAISWGPL
jgi:hypothetical protein